MNCRRWFRTLPFCMAIALQLAFTILGSAADDLTCLKSEENATGPSSTWYTTLQSRAHAALAQRRAAFEKLKMQDEIKAYATARQEFFRTSLGGFPQRTPLNAQTVGTLTGDGYRIEKVIFESRPNHHVTGNVYVPNGGGRFPAVLISSGHSRTAKTADYNQRCAILCAQHGMIALAYDPIGQGERSQVLTDEGKPQFDATTLEHFLVGSGSIVVGTNTATYRIWDAMRAIDYLISRADVDAARIGMTGCSGGGTLTSYTMALDDRIACAAPACYLTTFGHLIDTLGPQDSEQNVFDQIRFGMDHPDYVIMRAPKPTLISSTTSDFFSIEGSWDCFRQAKRIYTRLGASDRVDLVEAEGVHGVQPENLAAIVQWLQRWLVGIDRPIAVRPFKEFVLRSEEELRCTDQGQVLKLPGERSVFQLNAETAARMADSRNSNSEARSLEQLRPKLLNALKLPGDFKTARPKSNKAGKVQRETYHIDKLVIHGSGPVPLPALTFHPKDPSDAAYLYLHDSGKIGDSDVGGEIERLVNEGYVVVSVDLRGQGETAFGKPDAKVGDYRSFYLSYLLGESTVSGHAQDILDAAAWVAHYQTEMPREVHVIASGGVTVAALHAACLDPERFTSIRLRGGPKSWQSVAEDPTSAAWLTTTIHGVLAHYDLPELEQALPAGKLTRE
ncbi:MAG: acetylxylan esterase [Pirellulales bacterium]